MDSDRLLQSRVACLNRRSVLGGIVASAGVIALVGCTSEVSEYRFRMTVEVETPSGLKTGSSVYEITAGNKMKLTSEEGSRFLSTRGEAVAVDLAPGQTLFALLKTSAHFGDMATLSMEAFDPQFTNHYDTVGTAARLESQSGSTAVTVDPALYPRLVTFGDMTDPASVEEVDPANLSATFGAGYRLKKITIALTDDPVTTGIERRLPTPLYKGFFNWDGNTRNFEQSKALTIGDFAKGDSK